VRLRIGLFCVVFSVVQAFGSNPITPTTTLAAETGNNTSAAPSFQAQTNGNAAPGNVSKVATGSLLYNGSTTAMYAHFMPWFGVSYHMDIGYNSDDPVQVNKQVTDMISRGISGVIIDWYGPGNTHHNGTTLYMMQEAQSRNGAFQFAIMEDAGAIKNCANTAGCDITAALISDLNYITQTFVPSPAYMRWNGNPVIFYFGVESYSIDWTRVRANTASNLKFVFQNTGGFTRTYSDGGFSWVQPSDVTATDPMSLSYLTNFYQSAQQYPAKLPVGTSYKGFDDTLAGWSANRHMQQQCGQTWLQTFNKANSMWSTSDQLAWFQLVTWNDYEEGTEIETGIDNCVGISASVSGDALNWTLTGDESTIDHYSAFISNDGSNLMSLGDFPAGTRTVNLASFTFDPGSYSVYVKAVGKPSILNHMSAAATYTSGGTPNPQPPIAKLSLSPGSGTAPLAITASTAASTDPQASTLSSTIDFGDGSAMTGPTASHTYSNAGSYTVTATVSDSLGMSSQATGTVSIAASTPASVTIAQPANNSTVTSPIHVVANGTAPSGVDAMQIYLDGTLVFQVNASSFDTTVPANPGTHRVVVKLWDKLGAAYMQVVNVTVATPLVTSLSLSSSSVTTGASVTATVTATSGTMTSSQITWGDGTSSAGPSASHVYSAAGSYTVTSTATASVGPSSQASANLTVSAPAATLNVLQPADGATLHAPIQVVANGSAPSGVDAMQIYLDGTLVFQANASSFDTTVPASAGTHAVVVKLWDKLGLAYKKSVTVTVVPNLVTSLSLSSTSITPGASVSATLAAISGTIASSMIQWGDGSSSAGPSATHTYGSAGTYTVTGTASDVVGAAAPATASVVVQAAKAMVVMQSPAANSTVSTSVHVQGYSSSPSGIVAMQIYLDGVLIYKNALSQVDTFVNVSVGTHRITLKAWDGSGASYMQAVYVTAQ